MKKIFSSKIFIFLLGGLIFGTIGVIAANTIEASNVTYKNTTVEDAINTLYSKAKTDYTGATTFTPKTTTQTIQTENKILRNNITINPIPDSYKKLSGTATFNANDLVSGKTAFDNNGTLITGTSNKIYTEEEYQSYGTSQFNAGRTSLKTGTFTSIAGDNTISLGFVPKKMVVTRNDNHMTWIYDQSYSTTNTINISSDKNIIIAKINTGKQVKYFNSDGSCGSASGNLSNYYKTIGTDVVFHIGTAGNSWTYFATE